MPVHPTTARRLRRYTDKRRGIVGDDSEALFLLRPNKPLQDSPGAVLLSTGRPCGRHSEKPGRPPWARVWHSLRHSFAVRRLLMLYRAGADVRSLLPNLAVYLGHVGPSETDHYLTAAPESLSAAAGMFEGYADQGGAQ